MTTNNLHVSTPILYSEDLGNSYTKTGDMKIYKSAFDDYDNTANYTGKPIIIDGKPYYVGYGEQSDTKCLVGTELQKIMTIYPLVMTDIHSTKLSVWLPISHY